MSPLNRGPLLSPRMPPPVGMRPPPFPRFVVRPPMPGMPPRMPPPMGPMFGPMRQRMIPPRPPMMRPGGLRPLFDHRGRGVPPLMPPMMGPGAMGPRGPPMRPGPRGMVPPRVMPPVRLRFPIGNGNIKMKAINNAKKVSKLEELELKKPWMTDEIRNEIQKKNKLYAKAKKNKDAKEWEEFKDLRNKVTRMIRDAKNEYLAKNPDQAHKYEGEDEPYDQRDENTAISDDDDDDDDEEEAAANLYCEVCDRDFGTTELLMKHTETHKICGIDGCTFTAHPKLVDKHIVMQHNTGLYQRMKNISKPEDVEKWILERKRKYPTKMNIKRREEEANEKRERGEIIEERRPRFDARKQQPVRDKKKKTRRRKPRNFEVKNESTVELYRGLLPFAGTGNLRRSVDEEEENLQPANEKNLELVPCELTSERCKISDDEEEKPSGVDKISARLPDAAIETQASVSLKREISTGLNSLVANYGSDSEDDGTEAPDEVPIKRSRPDGPRDEEPPKISKEQILNPEKVDPPMEGIRVESCPMNNESAKYPKDIAVDNEKNWQTEKQRVNEKGEKSESVRNMKRNNREVTTRDKGMKTPTREEKLNTRNSDEKYRKQKRPMLLQRLLARSIQHERNLICQCIKYIADNNFFIENEARMVAL